MITVKRRLFWIHNRKKSNAHKSTGKYAPNYSDAREGWESPANNGGITTMVLYVYVDDVDAHFEQAQTAGAEIISEPEIQFYGDRNYEVNDCEGHQWTFGRHTKDVEF